MPAPATQRSVVTRANQEDGEGWEFHNTYNGGATLSISKNDLYDKTIFEGSHNVAFFMDGGSGKRWPY
jgi:hypothetical protein